MYASSPGKQTLPVPASPTTRPIATRNRWERGAITVWTVVLLVFAVRAAIWPHAHSVYPIFAAAGRNWLAGADLYGPTGEFDIYRYSPFVAVLLVPLAVLPNGSGGVLWRLLSAGVYLGTLSWWSRAVLPMPLTRTQRALLFFLALGPSLGSVANGQSNLLVIGLLLAAVAAVAEERWNLASVLMAVACLFKLYPIALGLLLVVLYPRRLAVRLAGSLAVGVTLPFLAQDPGYVARQYSEWAHQLRGDDRQIRPRELWYRDVRLLDWMWGQPLGARPYVVVQLAAAAGIAACCWYGARRRCPPRRLLTWLLGLSCCWMTVVGPATEPSTYTLLAPTLAWAVLGAWLERRGWLLRVVLLVSYGLFMTYHVSGLSPFKSAIRTRGPEALGGVLLAGGLVVTGLRDMARSRTSQDAPPRYTGETASNLHPGRAA